jgi:hypothetical protein
VSLLESAATLGAQGLTTGPEWLVPDPGDDLEHLVLNGKQLTADIRNSTLSGQIERTIEGASKVSMTVHDPDRRLAGSGLLLEGVPLEIEDHRFALAGTEKSGHDFTLTFEQWEIWRFRKPRPFRRAYRDKITRAQFIQAMVLEEAARLDMDVVFIAPSLNRRQAVAGETKRKTRRKKNDDRDPGLDPHAKLKVKGRLASAYQRRIGERALDVAERRQAPERARIALMAALIVESEVRDLRYGDRDSEGALQVRVGIHGAEVARSVEKSVDKFLTTGFWNYGGAIELARDNLRMDPATIAQRVQGSGAPSEYAKHIQEATAWVHAYGGEGGDSGEITIAKRYPFVRKRNESVWAAAQRLAAEVEWRRFMVENRFYYASEPDLFRSRPRIRVVEFEDGVDWIDYDWRRGMKASEVTVACRADRWIAPPGTVATVDEQGPQVDGKWLVASISRDLFTPTATITMRQPAKPKPEPAPETSTRSLARTRSSSGNAAKDKVANLKARCAVLSKYTPGYLYGGGHGPALKDLKATQPLDCSSSTSLALFRADLFVGPTAWVSGKFAADYGKPGKGKYVTIWANAGHVFIQGNGWRFDTGGPGGGHGPKLHNQERSTAGFTPRHPAGL